MFTVGELDHHVTHDQQTQDDTDGRYRAVFNDPEFRSQLPSHPDGAVATPHLFRKVAIPGVCVA